MVGLRQARGNFGPQFAERVLIAELDHGDPRIGRARQAAVFVGVREVVAAELLEELPHARLEVDQILAVAHRVRQVLRDEALLRREGCVPTWRLRLA